MLLLNALSRILRPTPIHLRGLEPIALEKDALGKTLASDANLEAAFVWLCEQSKDSSHNNDAWEFRRDWVERKPALQQALRSGSFQFQAARLVEITDEQGKTQRREVRCAEDRLVLRAMKQALEPVLLPHLSSSCAHLKGNGGLKQAVQETQDHLAAHPDSFVVKSDVQSYYASIDHSLLAEQLHTLLPEQGAFLHLVWCFMHRTVEFGGNMEDKEKGLPLGASLSPLLGAVYLTPLDELGESLQDGFYKRYMDDWVMMVPKRHALRKTVKAQYTVLHALGLTAHPDKTFIGKAARGFDFLGFHCRPTGLRVSEAALSRRDAKITRLYEQGASKRRLALYLVRWFGWVLGGSVLLCTPAHCNDLFDEYNCKLEQTKFVIPDLHRSTDMCSISDETYNSNIEKYMGVRDLESYNIVSSPDYKSAFHCYEKIPIEVSFTIDTRCNVTGNIEKNVIVSLPCQAYKPKFSGIAQSLCINYGSEPIMTDTSRCEKSLEHGSGEDCVMNCTDYTGNNECTSDFFIQQICPQTCRLLK